MLFIAPTNIFKGLEIYLICLILKEGNLKKNILETSIYQVNGCWTSKNSEFTPETIRMRNVHSTASIFFGVNRLFFAGLQILQLYFGNVNKIHE